MELGGQAVIEGVMMRNKKGIATAVRKTDGTIEIAREPFVSYSKRYKILGWPILRGAVSFVESLVLGFKWLSFSADVAVEEEEGEKSSTLSTVLQIGLAIVIGILVFMAFPYYLTGIIPFTKESNPLAFNLMAGAMRIILFLAYILIISFFDDVKRLFQYHGAEHKCIACKEHGKKLTMKNIKGFSTLHPRCGTSFLLIAAISCILVFAVIDVIIGWYWVAYQTPPWFLRVAVHLPLIPLVSGISYEFLKFTGKYQKFWIVRMLSLPGLGLQKITTSEPDEGQIEVAIASINSVQKL